MSVLDRVAAGDQGEERGLRSVLKLEQRKRAFKGMVLLRMSLNRYVQSHLTLTKAILRGYPALRATQGELSVDS